MRKLIALVSFGVLAACSGPAEDDAQNGAVAGSDEVEMQPGKWANTVTIDKFDIPGAPPEAAGLFQSMVGRSVTSEQCRTQEDIDKSLEDVATGQMDNEDCTAEEMNVADGKISGRISCTTESGGSAVMVMEGTHSATSMEMTMTADISDPSMPGGAAQMVMKVAGERVGDCDS